MTKSKTIIFRVTDEEYAQIEKAAQNSNQSANDWCRDAALLFTGRENEFTANEKILFEELAKARYLLGIGFGLLASEELDTESWNQTKRLVDEKGTAIADALLKRRK